MSQQPLNVPEPIAELVQPLFDALPLDEAMSALVVRQPTGGPAAELVGDMARSIQAGDVPGAAPALAAGLWLYVDDLDRSHTISQAIKDPTGSFWHGIMHRREGDFGNSHYWFRLTGSHPAMAHIDGYDGHQFIDDVQSAQRAGDGLDALVDLQRREWAALFEWCAVN